MKKGQKNVIYAWVLLLLFCAGQCMVFAHTHPKQSAAFAKSNSTATKVLKERCDVCDAMHHTHMLLSQQTYHQPVVSSFCYYIDVTPGFTPIQLVLAAGRAPPVA